MIEVSKANSSDPNITYNVDSVTTLETIGDESIDLIVSNYVIQDTPDYESAFKVRTKFTFLLISSNRHSQEY